MHFYGIQDSIELSLLEQVKLKGISSLPQLVDQGYVLLAVHVLRLSVLWLSERPRDELGTTGPSALAAMCGGLLPVFDVSHVTYIQCLRNRMGSRGGFPCLSSVRVSSAIDAVNAGFKTDDLELLFGSDLPEDLLQLAVNFAGEDLSAVFCAEDLVTANSE